MTLIGGQALTELLNSPDPYLTVSGVLEYQVCSDKVCYPPASLPLRWTLKARRLDLDRPPEGLRRKTPW